MTFQKITLCPVCNKEVRQYPSRKKTYCSIACWQEAVRITSVCLFCGKEFRHRRSRPRSYCSAYCRNQARAKNFKQDPITKPIYCEQCGEEIVKGRNRKRRFCSQSCFGAWQSENVRGPKHPMYGKPAKPRPLKGKNLTCPQCGNEFYVKPSATSRRRFCCKACQVTYQREHSDEVSGPNGFNWKGGYQPYYGPNWLSQRRNARYRDNYTCQRCGILEKTLDRQLDVHHKTPFREFGLERYKEANTLSNLISLCPTCHLAVEPRR